MKYYFIIASLLSTHLLFAQESNIQFGFTNPLQINPAFAGIANYRNINGRVYLGSQNIRNIYVKYHSISVDRMSQFLGGGLGLLIDQHNFGNGMININSIKGIYNYLLPVNKRFTIRAAIQPGFENKTTRYDPFRYYGRSLPVLKTLNPVLYDSSFNGNSFYTDRNYFSLGAGILFQFSKSEIGINVQNINQAQWAFTEGVNIRKPRYYLIHLQQTMYSHKKYEVYGKGYFSTQGIERSYGLGLQIKSEKWMGVIGWAKLNRHDRKHDLLQTGLSFTYQSYSFRFGINNSYDQNKIQIYPSFSFIYLLKKMRSSCYNIFPRVRFPDYTF